MKSKALWIATAAAVILAASVFAQYNGIVRADLDVGIKWAEVENQFGRRADLVPDLVKVAHRVADYEKGIVGDVVEARKALVAASDQRGKVAANEALSGAISRLLVVVENYPQIKADQAYIRLMDEMAGTENRIAVARRAYNNAVGAYNVKMRTIPAAWFAHAFGFEVRPYIEAPKEKTEKPNYDI